MQTLKTPSIFFLNTDKTFPFLIHLSFLCLSFTITSSSIQFNYFCYLVFMVLLMIKQLKKSLRYWLGSLRQTKHINFVSRQLVQYAIWMLSLTLIEPRQYLSAFFITSTKAERVYFRYHVKVCVLYLLPVVSSVTRILAREDRLNRPIFIEVYIDL